jgi:hypothetical protein
MLRFQTWNKVGVLYEVIVDGTDLQMNLQSFHSSRFEAKDESKNTPTPVLELQHRVSFE